MTKHYDKLKLCKTKYTRQYISISLLSASNVALNKVLTSDVAILLKLLHDNSLS